MQHRYEVKFGAVRLTYPSITEPDTGKPEPLYPQQARLRNLTYESQLVIDVQKTAYSMVTGEKDGDSTVTREWFGSVSILACKRPWESAIFAGAAPARLRLGA